MGASSNAWGAASRPNPTEDTMKLVLGLSAAALTALTACSPMPRHAAHHPTDSTVSKPAPAGYEQQMKRMQDMHQKMAVAKTPEERAALMKEHMKAMHEGMAMMGQMRGGMSMSPEMMGKRMDMMEMMMQMMMDREGMKPPSTQ
jgi:uncharacterized protein Yka (UPF0111/DUF47 family)